MDKQCRYITALADHTGQELVSVDVDRDTFRDSAAALAEPRRGIASRITAEWQCQRCRGICEAALDWPVVHLTADPHVCVPVRWWDRLRALLAGTGTGVMLIVPAVPAVVLAEMAELLPAGAGAALLAGRQEPDA